ncbi:Ribosome production factor 2 -like protein [Trichinella pseudospiralis]|uniref:Ribosome production factor 2 homolog n=2 Tax=Trichinella pseudospiralis TaxID=6337 RepID=A0A0V1DVS1_TRIPS|nr:Ribosome production factor 2 -like protein [Trichinella pseudospiralis]KRY65661.1 Ribosome production factor 2 -like protein [Trichinella pseudospiralis]KRY84823.1 Ribosome production factor 2 -like protein [Trichinella pseudospiralis]KRZ12859.1 Ribosome production factor 2 -like protein [Trichinella pseudospiralis]KRZ34884.1 Ribosome production factor 2 -like protein [Trichinella pseudospiralis]
MSTSKKSAKQTELEHLVRQPKTQAGKRYLANRAPKLVENNKKTIFIRGPHTKKITEECLNNLYQLKKPDAVCLKRNNQFRPFEDETPIEKFCKKYDASLFCFASDTKKRPNNLILGRTYDFNVLDMFEFAIESFASIYAFKNCYVPLSTKPCLVFHGEEFQNDLVYSRLKSLLIDFFRGPTVKKLRLQGFEYTLSFTVFNDQILMRAYKNLLKRSGSKIPLIKLKPAGPSMNLVLRRYKLASDDLFRLACKIPKSVIPRKKKNIEHDVFGTKHGRVHMQRQDLGELKQRKMKALKGRTTKQQKAE